MKIARDKRPQIMRWIFWKIQCGHPYPVILYENILNEHDLIRGIAPPIPIKPEHDKIYRIEELIHLYPCPPETKIPRVKRES